jgi:hypothetical protein
MTHKANVVFMGFFVNGAGVRLSPAGILFVLFAPARMVSMQKLKNSDYLVEIKIRLAVRKKDAAAVIALGPKWKKDRTEKEKLYSAVFDLIEQGLAKHGDLVQAAQFKARRIPSVAEFHDFVNETFRRVFERKPPPVKE